MRHALKVDSLHLLILIPVIKKNVFFCTRNFNGKGMTLMSAIIGMISKNEVEVSDRNLPPSLPFP
jgi:hypothetical protein